MYIPCSICKRRPSGQKSTSATSRIREFLLRGSQKGALTFEAGQKDNQCHGTGALARWAPLSICKICKPVSKDAYLSSLPDRLVFDT